MHNNVSRAIALPLFPFHNIIHHHFNASTFSHTMNERQSFYRIQRKISETDVCDARKRR